MIRFDGIYHAVEITTHGKFIKIPIDSKLIEYIVGTLISMDSEPVVDYKGITISSYVTNVEIGEIVAVKLANGELYRLKEGEDL